MALKCPFQSENGKPKDCSDDCALIVATNNVLTCAIAQLAENVAVLSSKIQK